MKNYHLTILLAVFFLFLTLTECFAINKTCNGSVSVTVYNSATSKPMPGVQVSLSDGDCWFTFFGASGKTDANGQVILKPHGVLHAGDTGQRSCYEVKAHAGNFSGFDSGFFTSCNLDVSVYMN